MDRYSAFILFRHPDQKHLVQCRAGYDVTREKRVQTNCYELRHRVDARALLKMNAS